ncbi:MAG: 3-deoxy-manno-octulosonate cytidylyltransferase [Rikenellaceae bacterium]
MKVVAIIPARWASTRFPAKPLAMLAGRSVIERVYSKVREVVADLFVATDDERIVQHVEAFGGRAIMTSPNHKSGTDRCWEAYLKSGIEADVVLNVQGDEPFIATEQIRSILGCFERDAVDIATLVKPFAADAPLAALENPNSPKVVVDKNWCALYFSRSVVPYLRGVEREKWLKEQRFYKHIGMYAFRTEALRAVTALPQGQLEIAESLEQLRWLENGYKIGVATTEIETIGIDTPADLEAAEEYLKTITGE